MNWDAIGAVGEVVGAAGVILTLVYLTFTIRQNSLLLKSQSRFQILEGLHGDAFAITEEERWNFMMEVRRSESPSVEDVSRYMQIWNSFMSRLEMLYFEINDGTLPKTFESTLRFRLFTIFSIDLPNSMWPLVRNYYTEEFQEYVDSVLSDELMKEYSVDVESIANIFD